MSGMSQWKVRCTPFKVKVNRTPNDGYSTKMENRNS